MILTPKQSEIPNAALKFFIKKGYNETSMKDISSALDIKAASLYAHIKSKNDISVWVCDDVQDGMQNTMNKIEFSEKLGLEKFRYFVLFHVEQILTYKYRHDIFLRYWKFVDSKK